MDMRQGAQPSAQADPMLAAEELLESKMRALLGRDSASVQDLCVAEASKACVDLAQAAIESGLPASRVDMLRADQVRVAAELDPERPGWVRGTCSFQRGNAHQERNFQGPSGRAPALAARTMLRCAMERHSWLCEGLDDEEEPWGGLSEEMLDMRRLAVHLRGAGGHALAFVEILRTEARWNHPRWLAKMAIEDRLAHCAKQGLLPAGFERARAHLDAGWPCEPTRLASLRLMPAHGGPEHEILRAPEGSSAEPGWDLPSLDQGADALWEALAGKIAWMHARGWPGARAEAVPSAFYAPHRSLLEAREIAKGAQAGSARAAPRSL